MDRPEHITCITRNDSDKAWCGRGVKSVFAFVNIDHAAENGAQDGRLATCPECLEVIVPALRNGQN